MTTPAPDNPLTLGFSPCPNDTYIFDAWVNGRLCPSAPVVNTQLEDVETLNRWALEGRLDVTKISFHAYAYARGRYTLLNAGGALGRGCGPLVVSKKPLTQADLEHASIAIPGHLTTAHLLLKLFQPKLAPARVMTFDEIMPAIAAGVVDAGVIIHESRFTYPRYGLQLVRDLGQWWEETTGLPIPLGGIVAKTSLGPARIAAIETAIRQSLLHANAHPNDPLPY
ncbi:MAG TPA: 1,4-dihydroxy-6-naphthoate synthase, partial [Planctomycetota bacterium]|nr:1,4-dihydroxy-6-naphthoate synthase [Planctomycetota bacterium]